MKKIILGLIALCFSSGSFAFDYCSDMGEYSVMFKKEITEFQTGFDKDMKDPGLTESHKKNLTESLGSEKNMCQILIKKHKYDLTQVFNVGVQKIIVKESADMYNEGSTQQQINLLRMRLIACYCQMKGHLK